MGHQDLERLIEVGKFANSFPGYSWTIDIDTKTTKKLLINEYGGYLYGHYSWNYVKELRLKFPKLNFQQYVPDLIDIKNKKIIEYQEEPGPRRPGAKLARKGHDEFSDSDKDLFYGLAGFNQLKIWESEKDWMELIEQFLSN